MEATYEDHLNPVPHQFLNGTCVDLLTQEKSHNMQNLALSINQQSCPDPNMVKHSPAYQIAEVSVQQASNETTGQSESIIVRELYAFNPQMYSLPQHHYQHKCGETILPRGKF